MSAFKTTYTHCSLLRKTYVFHTTHFQANSYSSHQTRILSLFAVFENMDDFVLLLIEYSSQSRNFVCTCIKTAVPLTYLIKSRTQILSVNLMEFLSQAQLQEQSLRINFIVSLTGFEPLPFRSMAGVANQSATKYQPQIACPQLFKHKKRQRH